VPLSSVFFNPKGGFMPDPQFERLFGFPMNVDREKIMTGQVLFRKSSSTPPGDDTKRKLHILIGIVAIPKNFNIKDHILYPVSGEVENNLFNDISIQLAMNEASVPPFDLTGYGLSGIVTSPMWRV
jgi:hypothetical protein